MNYNFDSIDEAIHDLKQGKLVIVMDDDDREYEGDFIGAASKVTPETVNFLVTYAKGAYVAIFMPEGRADSLNIPPMGTGENNSFNQTKFKLAVDAAKAKSGSSAHERAMAVNLLADLNAKADDFVRPGHVVPIEAHPEGLKGRRGHTEAGVELMKLAGFNPPVAVDLEILDDDGQMAKEKKLFELAKRFDLKVIRVQDIIEYLNKKEAPNAISA